jgi:Leucine-rich repeat (LRR) protein
MAALADCAVHSLHIIQNVQPQSTAWLEGLQDLRSLHTLHLSDTPDTVPPVDHLGIKELTLNYASIGYAPTLLRWCAHIVSLTIPGYCVSSSLAAIATLRSLTTQGAWYSWHDTDHVDWPYLTYLELRGTYSYRMDLPLCNNFPSVTRLTFMRCQGKWDDFFMSVPGVKDLSISICETFTHIPDGLSDLEVLTISDCPALKLLPPAMATWTALRELSLTNTGITQYPESLCLQSFSTQHYRPEHQVTVSGQLSLSGASVAHFMNESRLRSLSLDCCLWDRDDANSIRLDHLSTTLTSLYVRATPLVGLWPSIPSLHHLESLTLCEVFMAELPDCLNDLPHLQRLVVHHCLVVSIPARIPHLTTLELRGCLHLTMLPENMTCAATLENLCLIGSAVAIPDWFRRNDRWTSVSLPLHISSWPEGLTRLRSLTVLICITCHNLTSLPDGPVDLVSLQELRISSCHALTALPCWFGDLHALRTLTMSFCTKLTSLPARLGHLSRLQTLDITHTGLTTLPPSLAGLREISSLDLASCRTLWSIPAALAELPIVPLRFRRQLQMQYWLPQVLAQVLADRRGRLRLPSELWMYVWNEFHMDFCCR